MKQGRLLKSFQYAMAGIWAGVRCERNIQLHYCAAVLVMLCGWYWEIEKGEWLVLLMTIGIVISLEMINTAIEKTVDLVTSEYRPLAKMAKDIAAGAVLIFSCMAVLIGAIIFLPYIL